MSPTIVAFLFSAGSGAWFYSKMTRRSGGGNQTPVLIGTAVAVAVLFLVSYLLFNAILK